MKKLVLNLSFFTLMFFSYSCANNQSIDHKKVNKNLLGENKPESTEGKYEDTQLIISKAEISSEAILNKTFYIIEQTDSGEIIVDHYQGGIGGIEFTSDKLKYMGSENWRMMYFGFATQYMDIDSIQIEKEDLVMYLSLKYENGSGDIEKQTDKYKIELMQGKTGYIKINDDVILIDSLYSSTVPFIKEELSDVQKAIGDF